MVNIAKRMRGLKPLLTIRNGPGAAILPPAPAPQLVHVHLRAANEVKGTGALGGRHFWRQHLRRLKFHNPALLITVDYAKRPPTDPLTLSLRFEHKDPELLQNIPGSSSQIARTLTPQNVVRHEMNEDEKELLAREQDPNFRNAPVSWKSKEEADALHQAAIDAEVSIKAAAEASVGQDTESPAVDIPEGESPEMEASAAPTDEVLPSTTSTPVKGAPQLYTRTVTLGLRHRTADEIWAWFSQRTRCTELEMSDVDMREQAELDLFFRQSAIDRELVKEGREAVRKEKADLQRARGDADRLKQEAM